MESPQKVQEVRKIQWTPNMFKENSSDDQQELLTKKERFWLRHGARARSDRTWRASDPLSARRCLFPEVKRDSRDEESDESGYSYGSFLGSRSGESDGDDEDSDVGDSKVRKNFVYASEETQDCPEYQGLGNCKDVADFEKLEEAAYLAGIQLECDEESPKVMMDYPYADDCLGEMEVAYEVEI